MTDGDRKEPGTRIDARRLRALAHPLRMRILNILAAEGAATSTTLAQRLGESTGTLSWHLRHLAEHGLIEEDAERGNRRERWWRAPRGKVMISEGLIDAPELREPLAAVVDSTVEYHFQLVAGHWARVRAGALRREWSEASALVGSHAVAMSPSQLSDLNEALLRIIEEHSAAARQDPQPDAQPVIVLLHSFPVPDTPPPAS
jgi:DNA-binding transcriptional ArsR family regulator